MAGFISRNPKIDKCMATHLIKLNQQFGVMSDDYDKFFEARCRAISKELANRIMPQKVDREARARAAEDTVVEEEEFLAA